jgi:rubrerythrin
LEKSKLKKPQANEGVEISREITLEAAMKSAARLAAKGPNGETPVLVLDQPQPKRDRPAKNPGGMECEVCGCIFIGEEWHGRCAVCAAQPHPVGDDVQDLVNRLRDLSLAKHDDLSIGDEAAALIERLGAQVAEMQSQLEFADMTVAKFNSGEELQATLRRVNELSAQLATARADALEEACGSVRHECSACGGSGHADANTECEYCGRPMQAIRNLKDTP